MALKVIGAGFGRNGTLSMKLALEQLGFGPCHHMMEVIMNEGQPETWARIVDGETPNWDQVFEGYQSMVDWPGCAYYRQLADHYPDAKVLLSVRDPEAWYRSCMNTIFKAMEMDPTGMPANAQAQREMARRLVIENTFGGDIHDKDNAIRTYLEHNEEVKRVISPGRLLVYEVGEGWERLCAWLSVPVPDTPYPKTNTTEDFQAHFAQQAAQQ